MKAKILLSLAISSGLCFFSQKMHGQQIQLSAPSNTVNGGFFENFGVNFGFSLGSGGSGPGSRVVGLSPSGQLLPNIGFSQNNSVFPAFGGFTPGTGAQFGFSRSFPEGGGVSFGFDLAQGSSRSISSVTPSLTIPNGGFGSFSSGSISPFVTGVIPVVGTDNGVTRAIASGQLKPYDPNRATRRTESSSSLLSQTPKSSAQTGDASVAEIKAQKTRARENQKSEYKKYIVAAKAAEAKEDYAGVRRNIRQARKLTKDPRCLLYTSPSPRDQRGSRMPSSA